MMNTQAVFREDVCNRIRNLSDSEVLQIADFIDNLEECEPNEETVAAMKDAMEGKNLSKAYDDIDEMMKDILGHAPA